MDNNLVENYTNAIRARPVLWLLPDGLREYAQQYEVILLDDSGTGRKIRTDRIRSTGFGAINGQ